MSLLSCPANAVNEPFVLYPYTGNSSLSTVNLNRDVCYLEVAINDPENVFVSAYKIGLALEAGLAENNERLGAPLSTETSAKNTAKESCFLIYSSYITLQKSDGKVVFLIQETLAPKGKETRTLEGAPGPIQLGGTRPLYATTLFGITDADPVALQARLAQAIQFAFTSSFGR